MGKHDRPDSPTILKRIIEECQLPNTTKDTLQRLSRDQLVNLYFYITELKRTNEEMSKKIQELHQQGNEGNNDETERPSKS